MARPAQTRSAADQVMIFSMAGRGADTLIGNRGNDVYIVDNTDDRVREFINEGIDVVRSTVDFSLRDNALNVENLRLVADHAINGSGNYLNNMIWGNSFDNIIIGYNGNDRLFGGQGNDTLRRAAMVQTLWWAALVQIGFMAQMAMINCLVMMEMTLCSEELVTTC